MRHCQHCKRTSLETEFYVSVGGRCKDCHKKITAEYYRRNRSAINAKAVVYSREWRKKNPEKVVAYAKKWSANNPKKQKVQQRVRWHVWTGSIKKPTECQKCGKTDRLDGHHSDYNKALEVTWLCRKCHRGIHVL